MSEVTSAPAGTPSPRTIEFRSTASDGHRVIYHEPICPDCGSFDITEAEIDTGDGINELGLICEACGTAWPVACVVDWNTRPRPVTCPAANRNARTVLDGDQLAAAIGVQAASLSHLRRQVSVRRVPQARPLERRLLPALRGPDRAVRPPHRAGR